MKGLWYKECSQGGRFIIKITPGENLTTRLLQFALLADVRYAMIVSALGSVKKREAARHQDRREAPITPPRVTIHQIEGRWSCSACRGTSSPERRTCSTATSTS